MSSSLGRLGSSVAAATARRRSAAGFQQSASHAGIHKLVPTAPTAATAAPTAARLFPANRIPLTRHIVGRSTTSLGSSCGLLRPPRAASAQTTPPQLLAPPCTSRSCGAPFAATIRAFTAHSGSGGLTTPRCNVRQSSPPPSSLLLPQLLLQQQHRYKWDFQHQRRMMSATGGAGEPGAGPGAGAAGEAV